VFWQGLDLDFTGVVFDGGDFTGAEFSSGRVRFDLQRPVPGRRDLLTMTDRNTAHGIDPSLPVTVEQLL
jgi:hypothetical protein